MTPSPLDYYRPGTASAILYEVMENAVNPVAPQVHFFSEWIADTSEPILEVGCGTGRVAWALAQQGYSVIGVDPMKNLLDVAQQRGEAFSEECRNRVQFVHASGQEMDVGNNFSVCLAPGKIINHLMDQDLAGSFLARIRQHVRGGGYFIFDSVQLPVRLLESEEYCRNSPPLIIDVTSPPLRLERRIDSIKYNTVQQHLEVNMHFLVRDVQDHELRNETQTLHYHWLSPQEIHLLLDVSGFRVVGEYADWQKTPPTGLGDRVWVAEAV